MDESTKLPYSPRMEELSSILGRKFVPFTWLSKMGDSEKFMKLLNREEAFDLHNLANALKYQRDAKYLESLDFIEKSSSTNRNRIHELALSAIAHHHLKNTEKEERLVKELVALSQKYVKTEDPHSVVEVAKWLHHTFKSTGNKELLETAIQLIQQVVEIYEGARFYPTLLYESLVCKLEAGQDLDESIRELLKQGKSVKPRHIMHLLYIQVCHQTVGVPKLQAQHIHYDNEAFCKRYPFLAPSLKLCFACFSPKAKLQDYEEAVLQLNGSLIDIDEKQGLSMLLYQTQMVAYLLRQKEDEMMALGCALVLSIAQHIMRALSILTRHLAEQNIHVVSRYTEGDTSSFARKKTLEMTHIQHAFMLCRDLEQVKGDPIPVQPIKAWIQSLKQFVQACSKQKGTEIDTLDLKESLWQAYGLYLRAMEQESPATEFHNANEERNQLYKEIRETNISLGVWENPAKTTSL